MSEGILIQKLKHNPRLQNDIRKCVEKFRAKDNLFLNLENYLYLKNFVSNMINLIKICLKQNFEGILNKWKQN